MCCCKHASRRRRRACLAPAHAVLDLQLHCQVVNLSNQLSHGSATSTTAGSAVIIMNARVSAGMVANALRFTVCSCLYRGAECQFGSAIATVKHGLSQGSVRKQASATHAKTNRAAAPPPAGLSQPQRHQAGQPLARRRPPDAKGRITRRPTDRHEPPRDIDGQPQPPAGPPAAPPNKRAASRPPEGGPARDDDGPIDHPRSRSTPAACPERRPRAPTARRPRRTANWSTASGASGSTASLHQYRRRT